MEKNDILHSIKEIRDKAPKRSFKETFDFIVNLKDINLKNPIEKVEFYVNLPHGKGKKNKVCGFVGPNLLKQAKEVFDLAIPKEDFDKWDKRETRKLANSYDFFVSQVSLMADVGKAFGKALAPRGLMPNPKVGCIVPETADLKIVADRLSKMIKVATKNEASIKCSVGTSDMKDEAIAENVQAVYSQLIHELSKGEQNVKNVMLKLTMSSPIVIKHKKEAK